MSESMELTLDQLANETEEILDGFDQNANLFDGLPPIKEGKYTVSLKLTPEKSIEKKIDKNGHTYYQLNLVGQVQDPGGDEDKKMFWDRINTILLRNTNRVASLLRELGQTPLPSASGQALQLARILEGGATVKAKLQWEASWKDANGVWQRVKKADSFPKDGNGKPVPKLLTPDGEEVDAKVAVVAYEGV